MDHKVGDMPPRDLTGAAVPERRLSLPLRTRVWPCARDGHGLTSMRLMESQVEHQMSTWEAREQLQVQVHSVSSCRHPLEDFNCSATSTPRHRRKCAHSSFLHCLKPALPFVTPRPCWQRLIQYNPGTSRSGTRNGTGTGTDLS